MNAFDQWVRVESGRPEQAIIGAELARIVADLTVRVEPDPGDAVTVGFFCNWKTAEEVAAEEAWFALAYPDQDHSDVEGYDVQMWTVHFRNDESSGGYFDVPGHAVDGSYRIERMADVLQDLVIDATWVARPRCPGHPHPMVIRAGDDGGWWACPKSSVRCDIGGYRALAAQAGLTVLDD